jgi:hypothetical protein
MSEIKEDWAKFIISQALVEIRTEEDIPKVIEKVKGTALYGRKDLWKIFLDLVEAKRKLLASHKLKEVVE